MDIKLLVQEAGDSHRAAQFRPRDMAVIERETGRLNGIVSGSSTPPVRRPRTRGRSS